MARKKQPQNLWIKISYLFIVFCLFVFINLYCSDWIVHQIQGGLTLNNDIFYLNYVQNTGAAFNILHNYPFLLIALSVIALVVLFSYIIRHAGTMSYAGILWLAVMMSGIFCNLFERVQLGYVRDYISLKFVEFPVFNFSDIFINISVIAIILLLLKRTQLKQL
ncbi:signal peptidase II [bacterium]|nr:signal peptidase II [bacterium]